jgi:ABC-type lipoprotein export system ATPase subunit
VEAGNLTKIFGDGLAVHALDGVDLVVHEGEFVAIMGPSGSGKSTMLHLIGALERPTSGELLVAGHDLTRLRDLDRFRAETVGFVFQMHNLIPTLTALENVAVPMQPQPISPAERRERAEELLSVVGLADRMHFLPNQLSGGQRQRVAIARALANQPYLLLADEPTGNLDSKSGAEVIQLLRQLNREHGVTILLVTHDPQVARSTDRIVTLRDGRVEHDEPVGNVYFADLKAFRDSTLGRSLLQGDGVPELEGLGLQRDGALTDLGEHLRRWLQSTI